MKVRLRLRDRSVEGIPCPIPVVRLRVRDRYGALAELDFRVDTQADFTSIPVQTAREEAIPFSEERERPAIGLVGETTMYCDRVRVVIAGREHDWPCRFVNTPPPREPGQQHRELPAVLGRAGFLDEYAIAVDSGYLIITRIGPLRRWLRQCLHALWTRCGMVHAERRPL
jgi:hypothetical protein